MNHLNYRLNSEQCTKTFRKNKLLKPLKNEADVSFFQRCLTKAYAQIPDMVNTLDCIVHCEEWAWLNSKRQVYFFDNAKFAEQVKKGSYKVESMSSLYDGDEQFMLMLPKDIMIGDKKAAGGVLVTIGRHESRADTLFNPFLMQ